HEPGAGRVQLSRQSDRRHGPPYHAAGRARHPLPRAPGLTGVEGILDILVSAAFWAAAIRIATPLLLGTLGELICERAGVLNLGIEGIMTAGAMTGWMAVYQGADLWTGVAVAAGVGMAFGLLHAL